MPHRKFIVIDDFQEFDVRNFNYQLNDQAYPDLEVNYLDPDTHIDAKESDTNVTEPGNNTNNELMRIYLKTPVLELGQICHYHGEDYIDLQIPDSYSCDFRDYLVTIDQYHLAQVEANQKIWGYDGSVTQTVLSQKFRNLLNFSSKNNREYLLVKFNQSPKLFDQNDHRITLADLHPGQKTRAILELEGLFTQDGQLFYTQLNLVQLKTRIQKSPISNKELKAETSEAKVDKTSETKVKTSEAKADKILEVKVPKASESKPDKISEAKADKISDKTSKEKVAKASESKPDKISKTKVNKTPVEVFKETENSQTVSEPTPKIKVV